MSARWASEKSGLRAMRRAAGWLIMSPADAAVPSMTVTTGLAAATVASASCRLSPPATLPPGLSTVSTTAATLLSLAKARTASASFRSDPMMPLTLTRATWRMPGSPPGAARPAE